MITNTQQLKQQRGVTGNNFNKRIKYHLKHHKLFKLRKGLYSSLPLSQLTDQDYRTLGGFLYMPSYISLETILREQGLISQWSNTLTFAGPYTKQLTIKDQAYHFRRLPSALLSFPLGIEYKNNIATASPERAICDMLYHNPHFPFDALPETLDHHLILQIADIFSHTRGQKNLPEIVLSLIKH